MSLSRLRETDIQIVMHALSEHTVRCSITGCSRCQTHRVRAIRALNGLHQAGRLDNEEEKHR